MRDFTRHTKEYRDLFIEIIAVVAIILLWEALMAVPAI